MENQILFIIVEHYLMCKVNTVVGHCDELEQLLLGESLCLLWLVARILLFHKSLDLLIRTYVNIKSPGQFAFQHGESWVQASDCNFQISKITNFKYISNSLNLVFEILGPQISNSNFYHNFVIFCKNKKNGKICYLLQLICIQLLSKYLLF